MRRLAIKVHRAATADEVAALAGLGVDFVGFDVNDDAFYGFDGQPLWRDRRHVLEAMLVDLVDPLGDARAVVELASAQREPSAPARLAELGVTLMQVPPDPAPDEPFVDACADAGAALVYFAGYVEASRPIDWVDVGDPERRALAFYEADFFTTSYDPRQAFLDPVPGALGLEQLDELASRAPLFVGLGATPQTIGEIAQALARTRVAGIAFRLADTKLDTYYSYSFDELVAVLEALPARGLRPSL